LTVGELYKRLVVDPPRNYPNFYQEVKDLLLMAKDDFPLDFEKTHTLGRRHWAFYKWFNKWLRQGSIETTKLGPAEQPIQLDPYDLTVYKCVECEHFLTDYWRDGYTPSSCPKCDGKIVEIGNLGFARDICKIFGVVNKQLEGVKE